MNTQTQIERHAVKVTFDNGDSIKTEINGSPDEIRAYYLRNVFNIGRGEYDLMARAVNVEFLR